MSSSPHVANIMEENLEVVDCSNDDEPSICASRLKMISRLIEQRNSPAFLNNCTEEELTLFDNILRAVLGNPEADFTLEMSEIANIFEKISRRLS
jgi:hypothetical protein